jgi:hypothetical protein
LNLRQQGYVLSKLGLKNGGFIENVTYTTLMFPIAFKTPNKALGIKVTYISAHDDSNCLR